VETFASRLRAGYGDDGEKVAFFVEREIGHEVTDLMWNRMTAWFVRYLRGDKREVV
jgi:hypothetical protein